jgi:O-antigen/teichoic acid export membrane protein
MTTKVLTMLLIFVFVKTEADVWKYALIFSSGMLINQIVVLPVLRGDISICRIKKDDVIQHIMPNLVLFVPVIAVSVYRTMDKIMLGIISTDSELGYYHASENVIRVPMAFVTALGTVMLPRMSNMISSGCGEDEMERVFSKSISYAMFISSSICLGIMTVAKEFVPLFFGKGFEKCIILFCIILPGSMFEAFANVIRTQYLIPRKKDLIYIASLLVGATINFVLNMLLIPRLDSVGASIGTLAAYATVCVVQAICVFREANIGRYILNALPFITSGVIMYLTFSGITIAVGNVFLSLVIKIFLSGTFYLVIIAMFFYLKQKIVR